MIFNITTTNHDLSKNRLKLLIPVLDTYNINYKLYYGKITKKHIDSLNDVIKQIIKDNFEEDYIILSEDDVVFTEEFSVEKLNYFINKSIELNLGVLSSGSWYSHGEELTEVDNLLFAKAFRGSQLIVLFKSSYDILLKSWNGNYFEDTISCIQPKLKIGLTYPFLTIQEKGKDSIIRNKEINQFFETNENRLRNMFCPIFNRKTGD